MLYGPSKLGKSALWQYVLGSDRVTLSCTPDLTTQDLYRQALYELEQPYISQKIEYSSEDTETKDGVSFSAGYPGLVQAGIGRNKTRKKSNGTDTSFEFPERPLSAETVSEGLSSRRLPLLFENYHRLNRDAFRSLCYDIRTFADKNVTTIFVGIPQNPYEMTEINPELLGRVSFMPFEFWDPRDLRKIALGGQDILNIDFAEQTLDFLTTEAAGSPLLMQLYSFIACMASGVIETQEQSVEVELAYEDFSIAIRDFGIEYLSACGLICERLRRASREYSSVPDNFTDALYGHVKEYGPKLSVNWTDLGLGPLKSQTRKVLINYLNKKELTRDLFIIDQSSDVVKISNPLFLAYMRWLYRPES